MLVTKEIRIHMGHRVPNHKSKCYSPHGHEYKIIVGVDDKVVDFPGASDEGMVIDFGDLKKIMMNIIDSKFDHTTTVYEGDNVYIQSLELINDILGNENKNLIRFNIVPFIPTAENLARYWYKLIEKELLDVGIAIKYVEVWETYTSTARYTKEDDIKWVDPKQQTLFDTPRL